MHQPSIDKLRSALPALRNKYPIESMAVFGSALRSDFNPETSDIDILIDFKSSSYDQYLALADELETLLGRKVDIVTKEALKLRHWNYLKDHLLYV